MVLRAADLLGVPPDQLLVVGDRLDTDILAGQRAGSLTALVLTGVSTLTDVRASAVQPDIVLDDLHVLLEAVRCGGA